MVLGKAVFTDEYKLQTFLLWYEKGKPSASRLWNMIKPEPLENRKPTQSTLKIWIGDIFKPQAEVWDEQVEKELEHRMVKEKVEMLSRHAELGEEMQDISIEYIREHKDKLTSSSAVRMLVAGIEIERDSRGLPQAIETMINKSDEDLLKDIMKIVKESEVEIIVDSEEF